MLERLSILRVAHNRLLESQSELIGDVWLGRLLFLLVTDAVDIFVIVLFLVVRLNCRCVLFLGLILFLLFFFLLLGDGLLNNTCVLRFL